MPTPRCIALAAAFVAAPSGVTAQHAFLVRSPAFTMNAKIPAAHTCDGPDRSPAIAWAGTPAGTRSLALVVIDPGITRTRAHWVVFDLRADPIGEIAEGVPSGAAPEVLLGARQGKNDLGRIGYTGPCPERGIIHRYHFRLYALDTVLGLGGKPAWEDLRRAMAGHVLAVAQLAGAYWRLP